jgi:hypothetical protein
LSTKNWWDGKKFPLSGNSHLPDWTRTGLTQQALEDGTSLYLRDYQMGSMLSPPKDVIDAFLALGFRKAIYSGDDTRGNEFLQLVRPDATVSLYLYSNTDISGGVCTANEALFKQCTDLFAKFLGARSSSGGRVYVLVRGQDGVRLESLGIAGVPLERGNYNPEVLEGYDRVVRDLKSDNPSGRVTILDGSPGTGKTYMVRAILTEEPSALFVMVPANLIPALSDPSMVDGLLETRRNREGDGPTVFIVEDADDCLGSRDATNVNAVSALLNLGDGIIGSLMDIRLVCTTNLKDEELDEAVTRPGRLSAKINVDALTSDVAEKLYEKLTGHSITIDERLTLAEVYSLARNDGWKPVERKKAVGFSSSSVEPYEYS